MVFALFLKSKLYIIFPKTDLPESPLKHSYPWQTTLQVRSFFGHEIGAKHVQKSMIWNIFRDLDNIFCFADGNKNIENAFFLRMNKNIKILISLYFYKLNLFYLNISSFWTDTTREIKKFYNFLNSKVFYIY